MPHTEQRSLTSSAILWPLVLLIVKVSGLNYSFDELGLMRALGRDLDLLIPLLKHDEHSLHDVFGLAAQTFSGTWAKFIKIIRFIEFYE